MPSCQSGEESCSVGIDHRKVVVQEEQEGKLHGI